MAVKLCRPRDVSGNRSVLTVYTDADWGGSEDRRSQTACHFEADGIALGGFSRWQACLSFLAESELYAISSGMGEGNLLRRVFEHAGCCVIPRVRSDASAARAICRREGVGNIKHAQARVPWVQDEVKSKRVTLLAVASSDNLADLGTKALGKEKLTELREACGLFPFDVRHMTTQ